MCSSSVPFNSLRRLPKQSFQVRSNVKDLVKILNLRWGIVSPTYNTKLEDHPLSVVRGCYPPELEAVSSIHNLRKGHAVVTRGTLNMVENITLWYEYMEFILWLAHN
jgi:hypothetical protein